MRALLHDHDGILRVALDVLDQNPDVLGGLGRTLRELAHLVRDHGEAQPRLARARGLDGRVERDQVGLRSNVLDGVDDLGDLERAVAEALDLLGDGLHLVTDPLHPLQAVPHSDVALLRGLERLARRLRRGSGVLGHLADGQGERLDGGRNLARLARLGLRALGHAPRRVGHLVGADRHLHGRHAHVGDDGADLGDHEVDRIDHVAEDVGGDVTALRQIAL